MLAGAPSTRWRRLSSRSGDDRRLGIRPPRRAQRAVLAWRPGMGIPDPFDGSLLKALGHPLRLRLLEAISERGEASPVGLAREFDQPLATVSHHVRLLRHLGYVELVRTVPRRGAVEHFYRAVSLPFIDDAEWERLPLAMRRGLARQTLRGIFAEASRAGAQGGFDDAAAALVRLALELDERGRRELSATLTRLINEAGDIQRRSDARRSSQAGAEGVVSAGALAIMHYRLTSAASPTTPAKEHRLQRAQRPRLP
jgi:DNA-binding transcriptional ArsR family regulator